MATVCKLRYFRLPLLVSRTLCTSENSGRKSNVPSFDSREVASILKKITGRNLNKIFSARKQEVGVPSYKLMTDAEFMKAQEEVERKAEHLLEMPPVMEERQEIHEVLEQNDELACYSESRYVFTDISTSVCDRIMFQQNQHEDVLDLACVQFEPDSADYIR
ncbi:28S ribosomal protein S22, partial [Acropora cervicornis]